MWQIEEHRRLDRQLSKIPRETLMRYEKWKDIAQESGPAGLKQILGFHDELLIGEWRGHRSSRLGAKYRVIYQFDPARQLFQVISVTSHDYRKA